MNKLRCFLDLDGVLVDFVGAVEKKYGVKIDRWDFEPLLPVSKEEFWASCDEPFWRALLWTSDGLEILRTVEEAVGKQNVCILTSPCLTYGCAEGKIAWIERNLPQYRRRYFLGTAKEMLAAPHHVLIDDHDKNVDRFRSAGGQGIIVPRLWNRVSVLDDPEISMGEYIEGALDWLKNGKLYAA